MSINENVWPCRNISEPVAKYLICRNETTKTGTGNCFRSKQMNLIAHACEIAESYADDDMGRLTLRQMFYRLVSENLIENTPKEYDNLGETLSKARKCGAFPWDIVEDRTRSTSGDYSETAVGPRVGGRRTSGQTVVASRLSFLNTLIFHQSTVIIGGCGGLRYQLPPSA